MYTCMSMSMSTSMSMLCMLCMFSGYTLRVHAYAHVWHTLHIHVHVHVCCWTCRSSLPRCAGHIYSIWPRCFKQRLASNALLPTPCFQRLASNALYMHIQRLAFTVLFQRLVSNAAPPLPQKNALNVQPRRLGPPSPEAAATCRHLPPPAATCRHLPPPPAAAASCRRQLPAHVSQTPSPTSRRTLRPDSARTSCLGRAQDTSRSWRCRSGRTTLAQMAA